MTINIARQPAGVPTGGQFAASARTEADVALAQPKSLTDLYRDSDEISERWGLGVDAERTSDQIAAFTEQVLRDPGLNDADRQVLTEAVDNMVNHPDEHEPFDTALNETRRIVRAALIAEDLGDGPDLTPDEQQVLNRLLTEANHQFVGNDTDFESMLENLDTYGTDTSWDGVDAIGELLWAHHEQRENPGRIGDFSVNLHRSGDFDVQTYSVGYYLGREEDAWLTQSTDSKYLSTSRMPEEWTGLRKALAVASCMEGDHGRLADKAARLGLVGTTPAKSPWPEDDEERERFLDWQHEVGNGDTNASFRDWYATQDD